MAESKNKLDLNKTLNEKIKKLEKQIEELKEQQFAYEIGDILMCKENLLLVKVVDRYVKKGMKYYIVYYNHMKNYMENTFYLSEQELEEKPYDYNKVIFEGYLEYRDKYKNLLNKIHNGNF